MKDQFKKQILSASLLSIGLSFSSPLIAAKAVDLYHQPGTFLTENVKELSREIDSQGTTHIRMQQLVNGYPVLGGDYVVHIPKGEKINGKLTTLTGVFYQNLEADLKNTPPIIFSNEQRQKAIAYIQKTTLANEKLRAKPTAKLIVYLDERRTAHWAYHIRFMTDKSIPVYLIDPVSFKPYQEWNDLRTLETVSAGGAGGNPRTGMKNYDGLAGNLPMLTIQRDPNTNTCYLRNEKATLKQYSDFSDIQFKCETPIRAHNNLYWDAQEDFSGGGYSPSNDTLYAANVTWDMFQNWYQMPIWKDKNGKAKRLIYLMHSGDANASFNDDGYIIIGDALHTNEFYPFTTLDIIAHEIGHGVTYQASNLIYYGQSGGINESFSDMTGKAAEYSVTKAVDWKIGEIYVDKTKWIRYMDQPSKDCESGKLPGDKCSIDNVNQIPSDGYLNVHYFSGIFNRAFYFLATTPDWDVKKAYTLMLHANKYYWTEVSSFCQAARSVWLASKQLNYDENAVLNAFNQVGIDAKYCTN